MERNELSKPFLDGSDLDPIVENYELVEGDVVILNHCFVDVAFQNVKPLEEFFRKLWWNVVDVFEVKEFQNSVSYLSDFHEVGVIGYFSDINLKFVFSMIYFFLVPVERVLFR